MRWLTECSLAAVAAAVRQVAPWLADEPITLSDRPVQDDPHWASSSAMLGDRYVVKFAWAEPAARRLHHEITVLRALSGVVARLPTLVATGIDPLLLVIERVSGASLFTVRDTLSAERIGEQLAGFLAELHRPEVLARLRDGTLGPPAEPPPAPDELRGLARWLPPAQHGTLARCCEWAERVLAMPGEKVVVHGDFHGDNQVWVDGELALVIDLETVGLAEPEYDFRGISPADRGVAPLPQTLRHYQRRTGRALRTDRVLAWHTRTVLGDALWRSAEGWPMPDGRGAEPWLDDLVVRLRAFGVDIDR